MSADLAGLVSGAATFESLSFQPPKADLEMPVRAFLEAAKEVLFEFKDFSRWSQRTHGAGRALLSLA